MVIESADWSGLRWIPLLPLLAAMLHGVFLGIVRRELSRGLTIFVSCGAVLGSFLLASYGLFKLIALNGTRRVLGDSLYSWIGVGVGDSVFNADLAFQFDALAAVMTLIVTGVGFLIHVYSVGYMDTDHRDDGGFQRFFCYLNLFLFSMLVLLLGDNVLLMFLGWEGVGLCSYLLIGFWYSERDYAYAGSKAFIVNRIGDFGFLIGIFLLFWSLAQVGSPTISFRGIEASFAQIAQMTVQVPAFLGGVWKLPTLIGVCFFVGAIGKSAQIPLFVWLPDAMAGPTPVSALIHAATMVTAGVYMVCRFSFLYEAAPGASMLIAWTGGITALFAATIALAQTDIKKVLAYSTVSQLGYMFLAAGSGAYNIAIFHVMTHAFFKALLFMGAGAVIVAVHHEQDMTRMGGLRKSLGKTHIVMLIGVAAIAGFPLFSGFFSKDEILLSAYLAHDLPGHVWLYWIGLITAAMTAFYMSRLLFLTFYGPTHVDPEHRDHVEDPANWMMVPLYVLAILSIVGGAFGLPQFWGDLFFGLEKSDSLGHFLGEVLVMPPEHTISAGETWLHVVKTVAFAGSGFALALYMYVMRPALPGRLAESARGLHTVLVHKWYVDELYDRVIVRPLVFLSDRVLYRGLDAGLLDGGIINGSARLVRGLAANGLKYAQTGFAQSYLLVMVVGTLLVITFLLAN